MNNMFLGEGGLFSLFGKRSQCKALYIDVEPHAVGKFTSVGYGKDVGSVLNLAVIQKHGFVGCPDWKGRRHP